MNEMTQRVKKHEVGACIDEYRSVLLVLLNVLSIHKRIDALNKFFIQTEDVQLKQSIGQVLDFFRTNAVYVSNPNMASLLNFSDQRLVNLYNYCSTALISGRPQWQILAECAGWRPPYINPTV